MTFSFTKSMLFVAGGLFIASAAALASAQSKIGSASGNINQMDQKKQQDPLKKPTGDTPAKPNPGGSVGQLPAKSPPTSTHSCSVGSVAVYQSRVHVYCTNAAGAAGDIRFFAAATSDPSASMFIQVAAQAKSVSQKVSIEYSTKTADNPAGCQANDCRKILVLSW